MRSYQLICKRILIFSFCQLLGCNARTQDKISLTVGPALFSPPVFAIQPGVEYHFKERLSLLTELGIPVWNPDRFRNLFPVKAFRISTELRFQPGVLSRYLAFQNGFLSRQITNRTSGYFLAGPNDDSGFVYTSAVTRSPVIFSALKYGELRSLGSDFYGDFFIGAGIRYIFTTVYPENISPALYPENRSFLQIRPADRCDCSQLRLHLTAGIRFIKRY